MTRSISRSPAICVLLFDRHRIRRYCWYASAHAYRGDV